MHSLGEMLAAHICIPNPRPCKLARYCMKPYMKHMSSDAATTAVVFYEYQFECLGTSISAKYVQSVILVLNP